MLRLTLALVLTTLCYTAQANSTIQAQVIDTQIGLDDWSNQPTLCLIVAREIETGRLLGVVEDIYDCFWTREARHHPEAILELPLKDLHPMSDGPMLQHLQGFDSQLEFLWSDAD